MDTINFAKNYIKEISQIISKKYNIEIKYLEQYGENIISRFSNNKINDQLSRVGRNPIDKLKINERIISPIIYALDNNLLCDTLLISLKNCLFYFNLEDEQSIMLKNIIAENGIYYFLNKIIKLENEHLKTIIKKI
ncbi:hypothetical protein [Spiroplasma endosymbiont of Aspidapion aeneum]|uniref:mannitol dehydrogenase family protein n=1 Tax=Spiroplasma endosymbiont of Aspidapion aeneum TaxID=3066276 RepID=UPI00313ED50F